MTARHAKQLSENGVTDLGRWDGGVLYAVSRIAAGGATVEIVVNDDNLGDWVSAGELTGGSVVLDVPPWIGLGIRVSNASNLDARVCIYSGDNR